MNISNIGLVDTGESRGRKRNQEASEEQARIQKGRKSQTHTAVRRHTTNAGEKNKMQSASRQTDRKTKQIDRQR